VAQGSDIRQKGTGQVSGQVGGVMSISSYLWRTDHCSNTQWQAETVEKAAMAAKTNQQSVSKGCSFDHYTVYTAY